MSIFSIDGRYINKVIGIDIGSQKTMLVCHDAEIVLTDTGSILRPTLVSFEGRERFCGEESYSHIAGESTIPMINNLIGKSFHNIQQCYSFKHRKAMITEDELNRLQVEIMYCGVKQRIYVTSILAIYISNLWKRIIEVYGDEGVLCSIALPHNYDDNVKRSYNEACFIAGLQSSQYQLVDSVDALLATYIRKVTALTVQEKINLEDKYVMLLDMGHFQTTVIIVQITDSNQAVAVSAIQDQHLGAYTFDLKLFEHFVSKYPTAEILPGNKKGFRLLASCERIRKLLSQLSEASVTVEHIVNDNDISLSLTREDFVKICDEQLSRLKEIVMNSLKQADITSIAAVELLGGGIRMPVIQQMLHELLDPLYSNSNDDEHVRGKLQFGFKLDDGTVALGAALVCLNSRASSGSSSSSSSSSDELNPSSSDLNKMSLTSNDESCSTSTVGLSLEELNRARDTELMMRDLDEEIKRVMIERNKFESFILEMRNAASKQHGHLIDGEKLNIILDEAEDWLWSEESEGATLALHVDKYQTLTLSVKELCEEYFKKIEEDKLAVEKSLDEEALKASMERSANGEDDDDHDNRKLRKSDRMRLVVKNKEEGTELFKDKNYRPAAARYQKALTHCTKFFDLTKDDENEINQLRLSLYLNLASCYIKLDNWEQVYRYCTDAITIDSNSVKAYFRRSSYYEHKKEWEKAVTDLKKCQSILTTSCGDSNSSSSNSSSSNSSSAEDKAIVVAMERIKKEIQKEKNQAKRTWGKVFG